MSKQLINARISPNGHLDVLSKLEVEKLLDSSTGGLYNLFRSCSLAVLSYGDYTDDAKELLERNKSFEISVMSNRSGVSNYSLQMPLPVPLLMAR